LGVAIPDAIGPIELRAPAEVWGGIYVLEGSRLGGAMMRRSVGPDFPATFLAPPPRAQGWSYFLRKLEEGLTRPADILLATAAAQRVFSLFEQAGFHFLRRDGRGS
jgi:heme oxygenase